MSYIPRPQVFPDFLTREAPPNYIAGLGRGASGFTTRSDIGPARDASDMAKAAAAGASNAGAGGNEDGDDENFRQDPDNERGLFSSLPYEADDEEADRIYDEIEKKMDERRKTRREQREKEELEKMREERPKVQEQFADLKSELKQVSFEEWSSIPEVGDLVRRKGKKTNTLGERYTPVPDNLLLGGRMSNGYNHSIDADTNGVQTPMENGTQSVVHDYRQFGQARDKVLGLKLDQVSDSKSGQTTVDPKGYLTSLNSLSIKSDAEISDIKKARTLLRSVTLTNPKHGPGWIAAARLEEVAGKIVLARDIIAKGCEECPENEDVWLEAARLNTPENAKIILANAVRHISQSVKIWLEAMQLETDIKAQKKVLRRALEFIPNSLKIWKALISLEEDEEDVKILLSRAVECVPLAIELWLALSRLETYENAKKVLNKARAAIPTSHEIWIAAAKLEEAQGHEKMVDTIINRSVIVLSQKGSSINREGWLKEAENCEEHEAPLTCQAIVRATIGIGIDEEDLKSTWMEDAENSITRNRIVTARAIYAHALKVFPHKKGVWRRAALLEKAHGTLESMEALFTQGVKHCPKAEVLWLMWAKERWVTGNDTTGARKILETAFASNPDSEQIWLAAIKLEIETKEYERARILLKSARERANTSKVWMKSAVLERQLGYFDEALTLLNEALTKFPDFAKFWMIKGQILLDDKHDIAAAREAFGKAVKQCPRVSNLWILSSRLEEKAGLLIKARAVLERGRLLNSKDPILWCEAIRVEVRANNGPMAKALLAKALQECPNSGLLWSEAILMENRPQRKARSADALKKCNNDPLVIVAVARLFWTERKLDKARNWLDRAVKIDSDLGDAWAWYLKFEMQHGTPEQVKEVIRRCVAADPRHGERWQEIRKDLKNAGRSTEEILKLVAAECVNQL